MSFKRNCFLCVLRGVLCGERKAASAAFAMLMVSMLVLAAAVAVLPLPAQAYVSQGGSGDTLGYWRFNTKDSTPDDSGGRSNTATMQNMDVETDYVTGKFGYGLDFDGTDDYLSAGTTSFDSDSGTYEAWVNFDNWTSGNTETIFSAPSEMPNTDSGLVLHLRMNEASWSGSDAVVDVSGQGNHGRAYNGAHPTASGRFGRAGVFDGTDDYVRVADDASLDITSRLTLEAWVKLNGAQTDYARIICKYDHPNSGYDIFIYGNGNHQLAFEFRDESSTKRSAMGTTSLNDNNWHHVAATYDGSYLRVYVDGVNQRAVSAPGHTIKTNNYNLRVAQVCNDDYPFKGTIDEVRVYNRALGGSEIRAHYLGGISMHKNSGNNLVFHAGNAVLTTDVSELSGWHHVAGTYESNDARLWLDGKQVASDGTVTVGGNFGTSSYFANDYKNAMEFSGVMDEVRVLNYAKTGFGGGVVVNEVCYTPSEGVEWIELHNHGSGTVDCENWLFEDSDSENSYEVPAGDNYTIASGNFVVIYLNTTANTDSSIAWYTANGVGGHNTLSNGDLGTTDSIAVYDLDPDNDDVNENSKGKECMVDFAAWGGSPGGADANATSAGLWTDNTWVTGSDSKSSVYLSADGNNDEAVSDWAARNESTPGYPVPELPTAILFAVGLVVLVGYVYIGRRRRFVHEF